MKGTMGIWWKAQEPKAQILKKENMKDVYIVNEMQIRKQDKVNTHWGKT